MRLLLVGCNPISAFVIIFNCSQNQTPEEVIISAFGIAIEQERLKTLFTFSPTIHKFSILVI